MAYSTMPFSACVLRPSIRWMESIEKRTSKKTLCTDRLITNLEMLVIVYCAAVIFLTNLYRTNGSARGEFHKVSESEAGSFLHAWVPRTSWGCHFWDRSGWFSDDLVLDGTPTQGISPWCLLSDTCWISWAGSNNKTTTTKDLYDHQKTHSCPSERYPLAVLPLARICHWATGNRVCWRYILPLWLWVWFARSCFDIVWVGNCKKQRRSHNVQTRTATCCYCFLMFFV